MERFFSLTVKNVYDKYSSQSINKHISESVWYNNNIDKEYIRQWLKNGVRHIRDFLDPELKVILSQYFIGNAPS